MSTGAIFSGTFRPDDPSWKEDDAYVLWQGLGGNPFWEYMCLVMEGPWQDALKATIKKDGRGPHSMIQ